MAQTDLAEIELAGMEADLPGRPENRYPPLQLGVDRGMPLNAKKCTAPNCSVTAAKIGEEIADET